MISTLSIAKTNDTPEVYLDAAANTFFIEGYSMPEDSLSFYNPIIAWLHEYTSKPIREMELQFRMVYFHTASAKQIARMLTVLCNCPSSSKITIVWKYETDDSEMLRSGKRFAQQLGLSFRFEEIEPLPDPDME